MSYSTTSSRSASSYSDDKHPPFERTYSASDRYSSPMFDSDEAVRLKKKQASLTMPIGRPDLSKFDLTPPRRNPRRLHACVTLVAKAVIAIHIAHIVMVGVLVFLIVNYIQNSVTDSPEICLKLGANSTVDDTFDPSGYYYGFDNVEVKSPEEIALLTKLQQKECERFLAWLEIADKWRGGVSTYAVVNGVIAIMSMLYVRWLFKWAFQWQPKIARDMLQSMFIGFPKASFMVSYNWGDENKQFGRALGELPRAVGQMFPNSWLDIENLIPGTPVKETCGIAARHALFRFAFISDAYLKSPNCQVEWSQIKPQPGRSIVFYYPDTPTSVVKELDSMGHWLVALTPESHTEIKDANWFVNNFLRTRRANKLFSMHSPGLNEFWRPTLHFWMGHCGCDFFTRSFPMLAFASFMIAADVVTFVAYKYNKIFAYYPVGAAIYGINYCLPLLLLTLCVYVNLALMRTGYRLRRLPDVADCLIMLRRMGIIDPVRVHSNDPAVTSTPDFNALVEADVVELVDNESGADVKVLLLDDVADNAYAAEEIDESFVFWSRKGFVSLSNYAKDTFGTYLIGDSVPNVEFLGCKMIMAAFDCNARELSVGSRPFKTLLKRDDPMRKKVRSCRCHMVSCMTEKDH